MSYSQDVEDVRRYSVDWRDEIPTGESIVTSEWVATSSNVLATPVKSGETNDDTSTSTLLSCSTLGAVVQLQNTVTLTNGETINQSFFILIKDN